MSPPLSSLWGKTINEYFLKDPANAFFPKNEEIPCSSHIKAVVIPQLNRMREPTQDTCSLFKGVLSLLRDPKELRSLNNTVLLSRCMHALHKYADDSNPRGNKLFTYEYGFLCFRVIVLLVQVGILAHTKTFNVFVGQTANMSDPHDVSAALSEFVVKLMVDSAKRESNSRDWLLGLSSSRSDGRISLKTMGGLTDVDTSILVKIIWQDRKRFTEVCSRTSTPGWAVLLVLLGEHLQCASDAGWCDREEWGRFQSLALRYSLFASPRELDSIESVCTRSRRNKPDSTKDEKYYEQSMVDTQDARTVLEAYLVRMERLTSNSLPLPLSTLLLEFLRQDKMLGISDLVPSLGRTLCLGAWHQLDIFIRRSPQIEMNDLLVYATRALDVISRLFTKYVAASKTIIPLTREMIEANFLDLFARMVLLPLSAQNEDSFREYGLLQKFRKYSQTKSKIAPELLPIWYELLHQAHTLTHAYGWGHEIARKIVDVNSFHYEKIWRCFDMGFPRFCGPCWGACCHPYSEYIERCSAVLKNLTQTLKDPDHRFTVRCAYARCSAARFETWRQFTCEHCSVALYCSRFCQAKHWVAPTGSHRELCAGK